MSCGECHKITEKAIYSEIGDEEIEIIVFGDLLPTGRHSLHFDEENGILRINLPALLALSKMDAIVIAKRRGHPGTSYRYGRPLLDLHLRSINT